ncbi:DNA-3-methyladenine glycosylase 2 family protein [Hahella ganghwensis]|uniref:DNA-3-methyladenine glycosylase 2 family protein n=1 Tax=Hahella ganghwensis TaxID=286420 RepID=UPI000524BE53|nr:Ada metal-binding domain-containing protein [Hahella ganghwensis]
MKLDHNTCYSALLSRDSRFDGRFFVGVSSTGIYCRPVCRVKTPKQINTHYFTSAAAAEKAGYRPCLRCRPELAPGLAPLDSGNTLAQTAKEMIDKGALQEHSTNQLAARLGISDRYLRKIFNTAFGVSPLEYNHSRRLLLARHLLLDSGLSISDIALAAGFNSIRRFNSAFKETYRQAPSAFKRQPGKHGNHVEESIYLELAYRAPFAWEAFRDFLKPRLITGVENVDEHSYRRTLRFIDGNGTILQGWLEIRHLPKKTRFGITLSLSLLPQLSWLKNRIHHFLDLSNNPLETATFFQEKSETVEEWEEGLRVPGCFSGFETGVRAILGQQITVAAAIKKLGQFTEAFGTPIDTPFPELNRAFPAPSDIPDISIDQIASLGIIRQRAQAIRLLAEKNFEDSMLLEPGLHTDTQIQQLLEIKGIGEWTAQYIAMRGLGWTDAFPAGDVGVLKALSQRHGREIKTPEAKTMSDQWRPWRSYMTMYLWRQLAN